MSLPPGCAIAINNVTGTYIPNAAITIEENAKALGQTLLNNGYVGGQCGVDFDIIQGNSTTYQASTGKDWDTIYDDIFEVCIEANQPPQSQRTGLVFLAYFSTIIIMIGMGCNIEIKDCWEHLKRPWGVLVGVFCQFLIMPLLALAMSQIFKSNISDYQALIILLMGCSPGGSLSNLMSIVGTAEGPKIRFNRTENWGTL